MHEIQEIDSYLLHTMTPEDRLVFGTRILLDPALKEKVRLQRKTIHFIRWCVRQEQTAALSSIHQRLMEEPVFGSSIASIFK